MDSHEHPGGHGPERDEAADEAEGEPDAGASERPDVPPDRELPEEGDPAVGPDTALPRTPQAGL